MEKPKPTSRRREGPVTACSPSQEGYAKTFLRLGRARWLMLCRQVVQLQIRPAQQHLIAVEAGQPRPRDFSSAK